MTIYRSLRKICIEQRGILDEGSDRILSSIFAALPRLSEVRLSFSGLLGADACLLEDLGEANIMEQEFYMHHFQVVSEAIRTARSNSITIHTISLLNFDLLYYELSHDLSTLAESLRQMLLHVKGLRLQYSAYALELLPHCALGLHRLDMCYVEVVENALWNFLEVNKETIQSLGFHKVTMEGRPVGVHKQIFQRARCATVHFVPSGLQLLCWRGIGAAASVAARGGGTCSVLAVVHTIILVHFLYLE